MTLAASSSRALSSSSVTRTYWSLVNSYPLTSFTSVTRSELDRIEKYNLSPQQSFASELAAL